MDNPSRIGGLHSIDGPQAWTVADLERDRSWILELSSSERDEVAAAAREVQKLGLRAAEFGRADFPLPKVSRLLKQALLEVKAGKGAAVLRGLPVDPADGEQAARIAWGLGTYWGHAMRQSPGVNLGDYKGNLVSYIVDQKHDPKDRNVHGSATGAEQQPHTDPSELVMLLCVRPSADGGGVSRIVSAMTIFNELQRQYPGAADVLARGFHNDLRNEAKAGPGQSVTGRIPVYGYAQGHLSVNFNSRTIVLAAEKMGQPLSPEEQRALDAMLELAARDDLCHEMSLRTGDLQLLNNYTVMHSRTAWSDPPEPERSRFMIRMWLRTDTPRPLPEGFEGGYLTGVHYDVGVQARDLDRSRPQAAH